MDHLFTPWRYTFISGAEKTVGCVFCNAAALGDDRKALIVHRAERNFVILNAYPYTSGHVMVVPFEHVDSLEKLGAAARDEMFALTQRMESVLRKLYRAEGVNLGMNIGQAAGAGVAGHIHMHVLPRWAADSNFITVIGETRTLPEDLSVTWERVRGALQA